MPLKLAGLVSVWHDRMIPPGANWEEQIDSALERCSIILLLISANFFASNYCFGKEAKRAMERHCKNEALVIPVILSPCEWQIAPFDKIQVLPGGGDPVTSWKTHDYAWVQVAKSIKDYAVKNNIMNNVENYIHDELKDLLIRFLCFYRGYLFNVPRICKWGSKQQGFSKIKQYKEEEIDKVLKFLTAEGTVKARKGRLGGATLLYI